MKKELKENLTYKKTMLILSALAILSGLLSIVISDLVVLFAAPLLAAIFLFDNNSQRRFSRVIPILFILINTLSVIVPGLVPSFWSITAIGFATVIHIAYIRCLEKSYAAFFMTLIGMLSLALGALAIPMIATGKFDLGMMVEFYNDLIDTTKETLVSTWEILLSQLPPESLDSVLSSEQIALLFDHQINMTVSYAAVFSFILAGFSFKIFTFIVSKCVGNGEEIRTWRFSTSNVFAYAYFALAIIMLFITDPTSIFAITVYNLFNIFVVIYFYLGFNAAAEFLAKGRNPKRAHLLLLVLVITFFGYALEILALVGAFSTIRQNSSNVIIE